MNEVEALWRSLGGGLRAYFSGRTRDANEVDDLVQETFLRAHTGLAELRDAERAEAWLARIARNVWIDARRRARGVDADEIDPPAPDDAPELTAVVAGWLDGMISALEPVDREILRRHDLEREPLAALADSLGLSLSATKARARRGREKLRLELEACCRFEFDRRGGLLDVRRRSEDDACGC